MHYLPGNWSCLSKGNWVRAEEDVSEGKGAFAKVFCAWDSDCSNKGESTTAVKVIPFTKDFTQDDARAEASVMKAASDFHPDLPQFKHLVVTEDEAYIATELLKGKCLYTAIQDLHHSKQDEVIKHSAFQYQARQLIRSVFQAVALGHGCKIVHNDVKCTNFKFREDADGHETLILLDYGLTVDLSSKDCIFLDQHCLVHPVVCHWQPEFHQIMAMYGAEDAPVRLRAASDKGGCMYKSPEQLQPDKYAPDQSSLRAADLQAADVWAAGLVAVTILAQYELLEGTDIETLLAEQTELEAQVEELENEWGAQAVAFLDGVLAKSCRGRCTAEQALQHTFLQL